MDRKRFGNSPVGRLVPIRGTDARSGVDFDQVAFSPDALAEMPVLTTATWSVVTRAHHALGRLTQAAQMIPNPERLRRPTLSREAQSTSALEGTYAPLAEVMASDDIDEDVPDTASAALKEVLNYIRCARRAFAWIGDQRPLTVGLLLELHEILVRGTASETVDAGRVRRVPVVIGSRAASIYEARFIPPPAGVDLEASFADLVQWISNPRTGSDPVVAAALVHYQFETLHPFNDGNGRIGRLLVVVQLMMAGLLSDSLLSISPWFEARREPYQNHLAEVSATGDWDSWVSFFAEGIAASATDTVIRVDRLLELQKLYHEAVRNAGGRGLIIELVDLLIGMPYLTIPQAAARTGKTYPAAKTAINRLMELGILAEVTGKSYGRTYTAGAVMAIYSAPSV